MFKADYFTINGSIALGNANYFAKYKNNFQTYATNKLNR